ncbi:MAG: response regulator, partial [Chloroflexi bacterium]|nr:response regulator [Chloroflexota bacterium]
GQMEYTYFPVTLDQLGSTIRWHDLVEGTFNLGNLRITACYMNHPAVTLGYRFEIGGAEVVYATDHEPHLVNLDARSPSVTADVQSLSAHPEDWRHVEFLAGADLVIHDAQYTLEEYPSKIGWGHTPVERAVDFAVAAGNKRLAIFHHDPLRDDDTLDRLVEVCRQRAAACGSPLEVFGAAEGQIIDLPEGEMSLPLEIGPSAFRVAPDDGHSTHPKTILIIDDEPDIVRLLTVSLRPEGFRLLSTNDGEAALRLAHDEMPDLILLDWKLPTRNGLDICRAIRAAGDQRLREVPIVMLTGRAGPEETTAGFAAGATDYLTKPFTPAHVRSRVREWLLRARAGSLTG